MKPVFKDRMTARKLRLILSIIGVLVILKVYNNYTINPIHNNHNTKDYSEKQGFYYGKWSEGRIRHGTCGSVVEQHKCCTNNEQLHFMFHDEELNRINPVEELEWILRHKNILMIGDSTMLEFFTGVRELAKIKTYNEQSAISNGTRTLKFLGAYTMRLNSSSFYLNSMSQKPRHVKSEENITGEVHNADIIVLNQGLHYSHGTLVEVGVHFSYIGDYLYEITRHTMKQVILRSTTPQHFISHTGMGRYFDMKPDSKTCATKVANPSQHPTNYFLMEMARKYNFKYLDNFPIYYERGDLSGFTVNGNLDCTHHCYTPETIWPELVLLTQLIET